MVQNLWGDPQVISSVVSATATVIYVIATFQILRAANDSAATTRDIFQAAHRPYIGVTHIAAEMLPSGQILSKINVKNFGSVPAANIHTATAFYLDGAELDLSQRHNDGDSLFPGDSNVLRVQLSKDKSQLLLAGSPAHIACSIKYEGVGGKGHGYECRYEYYRYTGEFIPASSSFT